MNIDQNLLSDPDSLVLIVFSGETDISWLRVLKRGFRHCFACIHTNDHWVFYDPLAHTTKLTVRDGMDSVDLEFWFRQQGCRVVRTKIHPAPPKKIPPTVFTCVEAVKRLLGIHSIFILTPWQLYRHLQNRK